jgi:hypothetical protein
VYKLIALLLRAWEAVAKDRSGRSDRRSAGRCERPAGRANAKEVRALGDKSSWMRVAITIAVDWRFVIALVILALALLMK